MRRLETAIQRYAWGKSGSDSMVVQLKKVKNKARGKQSAEQNLTYVHRCMVLGFDVSDPG